MTVELLGTHFNIRVVFFHTLLYLFIVAEVVADDLSIGPEAEPGTRTRRYGQRLDCRFDAFQSISP